MPNMTMGLIIGNRGFFPDHLAKDGREEMIRAVQNAGMDAIVLSPEDSKYGAVETRDEARKCAGLFRANRDKIDGNAPRVPTKETGQGIKNDIAGTAFGLLPFLAGGQTHKPPAPGDGRMPAYRTGYHGSARSAFKGSPSAP